MRTLSSVLESRRQARAAADGQVEVPVEKVLPLKQMCTDAYVSIHGRRVYTKTRSRRKPQEEGKNLLN